MRNRLTKGCTGGCLRCGRCRLRCAVSPDIRTAVRGRLLRTLVVAVTVSRSACIGSLLAASALTRALELGGSLALSRSILTAVSLGNAVFITPAVSSFGLLAACILAGAFDQVHPHRLALISSVSTAGGRILLLAILVAHAGSILGFPSTAVRAAPWFGGCLAENINRFPFLGTRKDAARVAGAEQVVRTSG